MKRVIIIGAGISGLTTAWWLHRRFPRLEIVILEKTSSVGGMVYSEHPKDFHLNLGPKGFLTYRGGEYTLKLIHDLGLQKSLVFSHPTARIRYVHCEGKTQRVSLWSLCKQGLPLAILKDLCASRYMEDSTVESFLARHSTKRLIHNLWNPITIATCAGHSDILSTHMAYPNLAKKEASHGSIIRGYLKDICKKKPSTYLASLRPGMHVLVDALREKIPAQWCLSTPVSKIISTPGEVRVQTTLGEVTGDLAIYTGPIHVLPDLLDTPGIKQLAKKTSLWELSCVCMGWNTPKLPIPKGYGMLFADEFPLLGIVFQSQIFPDQLPGKTSIALLLEHRWHKDQAYAYALSVASQYLSISTPPDVFSVFSPEDGLPQHHVGFLAVRQACLASLPRNLRIVGQNIFGPGLNRCTSSAFQTVASLSI